MLTQGDYDSAVNRAVKGLRNNKDKKGKQDYVYMLEEAYLKANERDMSEIDLLAKDASPRNFEKIFNLYLNLHRRQESIKPLLPLKIIAENRNANFTLRDYSEQIVDSKKALSRYLYDNAQALLLTTGKSNHRRAYDDLMYLDQINPGYKNVADLIEQARFKGTDYVSVHTKNETSMIIPARLNNDLLNFTTQGLNDKWTVYHSARQPGVNYDFGIIINFKNIAVSPEHIKERQFVAEREIIDGRRQLTDRRGRVVRDSLGNIIMVDVKKMVSADVWEFTQSKAAQVAAEIEYFDYRNNSKLQSFPLASEFQFLNTYARYRGDRRAVEDNYQNMFDRRAVPFPSNEQIVFDTGEDLKSKLKKIISRNHISN